MTKDIINETIEQEIEKPTAFGKAKDRHIKLEMGRSGQSGKYFVSSTILSKEGLTGRSVTFEKFNQKEPAKNYYLDLVDKHGLTQVNELQVDKHLHRPFESNFLDSTGYYSRLTTDDGSPPKIKDLDGLREFLKGLDDKYKLKMITLSKGKYLFGIVSVSQSFALDSVSYFDDKDFFEEFWTEISKYITNCHFYQSDEKFEAMNFDGLEDSQIVKVQIKDGEIETEEINIKFEG